MPDGSLLRIEPVKKDSDEADYACIAQNGIGQLDRRLASLQVYSQGKCLMTSLCVIINRYGVDLHF